MQTPSLITNSHLAGDSFFWEGGPVGILLSHGFRATTAEVRPLGEVFRDQGYTVAGPLLPGHGTRPQALNRCRWTDWVAAIEEAYGELQSRCDTVFVGGESLGALLTLYLASKHPEIRGVLSYAPALITGSPFIRWISPLIATFIPFLEEEAGPPTRVDDYWKGYGTVIPTRGAVEVFRFQRRVFERLPHIVQPLFVAHGRLDPLVAPEAPGLLLNGVRSSWKELHWFERSIHCVILDAEWEQVAALSLRFIERILDGERVS